MNSPSVFFQKQCTRTTDKETTKETGKQGFRQRAKSIWIGPSGVFFQSLTNLPDQLFGLTGFVQETDVEFFVFFFRFRKTAHYDYRYVGTGAPEFGYKD